MELEQKRKIIMGMSFILLAGLMIVGYFEGKRHFPDGRPAPIIDSRNKKCVGCHTEADNAKTVGEQWKLSVHAQKGVGCLDCHEAKEGEDSDGFSHYKNFIATIVTPKDCARCHKKEFEQFQASAHSTARKIIDGSEEDFLSRVVQGHAKYGDASTVSGCDQCHGSKVEFLRDEAGEIALDKNGIVQLDPKTWPNTGMGRINPDGSMGSCAACHNRHMFSSAQARQPENCAKCHRGPTHPHDELYAESKHGINYRAHKDELNLNKRKWIVGVDYTAAPTCSTCHMSATPNQEITHNVGDKLSWVLRDPVSMKIDEKEKSLGKNGLPAKKRRENMADVCNQCHIKQYVRNYYTQLDNGIALYDNKYGIPAQKIMDTLKNEGLITKNIPFDDEIEWIYHDLWRGEGRRARMGVAMMGPAITQWEGFYELAQTFYNEFVPAVRKVIEDGKRRGKSSGASKAQALLNSIMNSAEHKWYSGQIDEKTKAELKK
ncbi:MAG: ammonia-forming cytochrome c nitrite reductase subunit c552 [Spirochaetia bacterium]|nr:ammonia-forming cytochrome c nitrite reductase subunit c552 [Spirochaetia bacterium]